MTKPEIVAIVIDLVAEQFAVKKGELSESTTIIEDLSADSLDGVELIMEIEEHCDLTIDDADAEGLLTIGELSTYVFEHQKE